MDYSAFRTGLHYEDVWRMLWVADPDPSKWRRKSKGAVLSLFRDIKQSMWNDLIDRGLDPETLPAPPRRPPPSATPFRGLVEAMLAGDPDVSGVAIFHRARQAGYPGSQETLNTLIAILRPRPKRTKAAPFRDLVAAMLAKDPEVPTATMLQRARQAGYAGSRNTFDRLVAALRAPRKSRPVLRKPPHRVASASRTAAKPPAPVRPTPALLSTRAAARLLGVSEDRVLLSLARGSFPGAFRAGRGWRSWVIPLSDITGPDPIPAKKAA